MNEKKTTKVVLRDDGILALFDHDSFYNPKMVLYQDEVKALRTFFQEERDTELNRWRDPLNPDMVCYEIEEHFVRVLNEQVGVSYVYDRSVTVDTQSSSPYVSSAKQYFEAHPVKKPWEKAAQGDIWVLTSPDGKVVPYTKIREKWSREHVIVTHTDDYFVDGYQLWPESQIESWDQASLYIEHVHKFNAEEN